MSTELFFPIEQIEAIQPENVRLYLESNSWKRAATGASDKANVFRYPTYPDAVAVVPRQVGYADYAERIVDLVQLLAVVEQRRPWEIVADLASPSADVMRLHVSASDAIAGALPLESGIRLIKGARDLLLAASCSARQPAAFFPRQAYKEALNFISSCQLGQTERGSFVAKVIAPVAPQVRTEQTLFEPDDDTFIAMEPFARQSTIRVMTAVGHLHDAIDSGDYENIFNGVSSGVSANLCDAIAEMQPPGDQSRLRVEMRWSPSRRRLPKKVTSSVVFSSTAFEIIRESARRMRERTQPEPVEIKGQVVSLKAERSLLDEFEGSVSIRSKLGDEVVRVHVVLNATDYKHACDAHRDGLDVVIKGILQRDAKLYHLHQPQGFSVIRA